MEESTVKSHVHRILQIFVCEDRTQAVVMALRSGIVQQAEWLPRLPGMLG
jgi:DNA-binding NarL/FixJ family response regulator